MPLNDFQQQLVEIFNQRSNYDNAGDFHPPLAHLLVQYAKISQGQQILDMATGTALVAIEAAQIVGEGGQVIGVDISTGMLEQARRKIEAARLKNIELVEADVEIFDFPDNSFDRVLCCSALAYLRNIPATLRHWYRFLKPNGLIAVNGFAETAFIEGVTLIKVAKKYGINLIFNQPTGTVEKCYALLHDAGFEDIEVKTDRLGGNISFKPDREKWERTLKNPLSFPLRQLSVEQLEQVKMEYFPELEDLVTDKGIWNDILTFSVLGRKRDIRAVFPIANKKILHTLIHQKRRDRKVERGIA